MRALPCDASEAADRTEPMTLEEIRAFVSERIVLLGIKIHDCVGIDLGDRRVDFAEPIPVRNAS